VTKESEKLEAVKNCLKSPDKHQRRPMCFLGLWRRFISGFADIAKPLIRLTEEKWIY
jgi:hypothetical protein